MNRLIKNLNSFYSNIPTKKNILRISLINIFDKYQSDDWKKYLNCTDRGLEKNKFLVENNANYKIYIRVLDQQNIIKHEDSYHVKKLLKGDMVYFDFNKGNICKFKTNSILLAEKDNIFMHKNYDQDNSFILVMEDKTNKF